MPEDLDAASEPAVRRRPFSKAYVRVAVLGVAVLVARVALDGSDARPSEPAPPQDAAASDVVDVPLPAPLVPQPTDAASVDRGDAVFEDVTEAAGVAIEHHAARQPDLAVPRDRLAGLVGTDDLDAATVSAWADATFTPHLTDVLTLDHYGTGQAWGDYDRDGDPDLYLTDQAGPNTLLENRGDGTFARAAVADDVAREGAASVGAVFVDVDDDGWLDLHVVGPGSDALFHNLEGGGFEDVTDAAGIDDPGEGETATWGDYDGDGDLDAYVVDYGCQPCNDAPPVPEEQRDQDHLFRNDGDLRFSDQTDLISAIPGTRGLGFSATWFDIDGDADLDLYVVNDVRDDRADGDVATGTVKGDGTTPGNALLRNDGPGCDGWCFTDVSASSGAGRRANAMGLAVGDADADGDSDIFFTNSGYAAGPTELLLNDGRGTFTSAPPDTGSNLGEWSWGTSFLDADNDGALDLYVAVGLSDLLLQVPTAALPSDVAEDAAARRAEVRSGALASAGATGPAPWPVADSSAPRTNNDRLLLRRGSRYEEQVLGPTDTLAGSTFGVAVADFDGDGWADVVTGDIDRGYRLLRNRGDVGEGNHRLVLHLEGDGRRVSRQPAGAVVHVRTPDGLERTRALTIGGSLGSGDDDAIIVGLGQATTAEVEVRWLDGTSTIVRLPADQEATIGLDGLVADPSPLAAT